MLILDGVLPTDLQDLDFVWEIDDILSKLLGVFVGCDISPQRMLQTLSGTLDKSLEKARKNPYTLGVRVQIVNQLVLSKL